MTTELTSRLEDAIGKMADSAKSNPSDSQKALHFSQASLNMSNALCNIESIRMQKIQFDREVKDPKK